MVYTFWEGEMPDYLKLCLTTWDFPYIVLNKVTVEYHTDFDIHKVLKRYTLPQVADCVRVHVLRDNADAYWLDVDTIMLTRKMNFPETIMGDPVERTNTIGYLHSKKIKEKFFTRWADYQDKRISMKITHKEWNTMGNAFTDDYVKAYRKIKIRDITPSWPETYMIKEDIHRQYKYEKFYFENSYSLKDIKPTKILMLHNSWTPEWYKKLTVKQILTEDKCTLSNIFREKLL